MYVLTGQIRNLTLLVVVPFHDGNQHTYGGIKTMTLAFPGL